MKIVHAGLLLLLTAGLAQAAVYKPAPRKATASHSSTAVRTTVSGKVKTLPASSLPAGAIVPNSRPTVAQQSSPNAPVSATPHLTQPAPTNTPAHLVQVAINPDRWPFYSYP